MTRPRKLLHVTNDAAAFAGHRLAMAKATQAAGFEVHVAAPPGPGLTAVALAGFAIHPIPLGRRSLAPWTELATLRALRDLYERLRPDIVHHVTIKPNVYGGLAAQRANVPAYLTTFAGLGYVFSSRRRQAKAIRAILVPLLRRALSSPHCTAVFENSGNRDRFVAAGIVPSKRAVVIKSVGVPLDEFPVLPEPEGEIPVFALASRMLWSKGVGEFVEAARRLRAEGAQARFVLIGPIDPGNPESIAEEQLTAWRDAGAVEVWGRLPESLDVFRRSDVLCLPSSYAEGVPRVLLEAAACGRPVIASDEAGCKEACQDGVTGFVVPVGDKAALADAIRKLAADRALRVKMGAAGRRFMEAEFDQREVIARTIALYTRLLDQASKSATPRPME